MWSVLNCVHYMCSWLMKVRLHWDLITYSQSDQSGSVKVNDPKSLCVSVWMCVCIGETWKDMNFLYILMWTIFALSYRLTLLLLRTPQCHPPPPLMVPISSRLMEQKAPPTSCRAADSDVVAPRGHVESSKNKVRMQVVCVIGGWG